MVFSDSTWDYFSLRPFKVRVTVAQCAPDFPFRYEGESFFQAYEAMHQLWAKRQSQRNIAQTFSISRKTLKEWQLRFVNDGTIGLLPELSYLAVDPQLEDLVLLIKLARRHESASLALRLADALQIPNASLDITRQIQRCYGYGQRLDKKDIEYFHELQHILKSVQRYKRKNALRPRKAHLNKSFIDFDHDPFQQKLELFKAISESPKKRQVRPILQQFGVHPNRFYELKNRYMTYGIWGLINLIQSNKTGEKISPELELQIVEERLMKPNLSAQKMISYLKLKCSRAHVQKVYHKWKLSRFKKPIALRGVISQSLPEHIEKTPPLSKQSCRAMFPDLITTANLKVHRSFADLINSLAYRKIAISNPGALIIASFLEQLGVVEALHTYGPESYRSSEITNGIIVNVLRIIVGFPTIADFTMNSDRSVALAAGLSINPTKSRFYDMFDQLRFHHLQKLRNDSSRRAVELGIVEGKSISIDYHCDPSDSRFPRDKSFSKSPDKNGDVVYAHRPQIIWDSMTNSIINIAYCEGASRAPSALYRFCEQNLFKIINPDVITEIYADSEYTGEKQLVYLMIRSETDVTMCLKQNPKIKRWKEELIKKNQWQNYGAEYHIASHDVILAETGKLFRFIVKKSIESGEIRCFGSTHLDYSPSKILDSYHIRWPVESGIKDLVENYFLNKPTGTSPEKAETHYYCVMLARMIIDYFLSLLGEAKWHGPQDWKCVLSTIRTTLFSNQNCELSLHESGDLQITYLDGDLMGIKKHVAELLKKRAKLALNRVSWWGNRGVRIKVKNQYDIQKQHAN